MDSTRQFVLFAVFIQILGASSWLLPWDSFNKCPESPNYDKCKLHQPCNPNDVDPCGCPHACCAATKPDYIAKVFSGKLGRSSNLKHELVYKTEYRCFKKGECNDLCDAAFSTNINRCGCGKGLTCSLNIWMRQLRCTPEERNAITVDDQAQ